MNPQSEAFPVGEQITLIQPSMGLGVGSVGTITKIYRTHPPSYRVHFAHIDVRQCHLPSDHARRLIFGDTFALLDNHRTH
jgi:hypothetical protein